MAEFIQSHTAKEENHKVESSNDIDSIKPFVKSEKREKAAIVILIRDSELDSMIPTLVRFETRFNKKFQYPYVFLNEQPFSDLFKNKIREILDAIRPLADVRFGDIPQQHWSYPSWINQTKAKNVREVIMKDVIYGGSESYRHMCRFQSGFFFKNDLLINFEYYWRLEPGTKLHCDVLEDPFVKMKKNGWKYGFTNSFPEYEVTAPTLWETTIEYLQQEKRKNDLNPTMLKFFERDNNWNLCHFWSNFEIGSLDFLRSKQYNDYFDYLDKKGGFFYERWGDAPVHSLAVGLFLKQKEIHFFEDIGYFHGPFTHCPVEPFLSQNNCDCQLKDSLTWEPYSCVPEFLNYRERSWFTTGN